MRTRPHIALRHSPFALGLGLALAFFSGTRAQSYTLDWFKVAGGGGTSVAGTWVLSGTVGQADAGVMSIGQYTLQGGFWPGMDAGGLRLTIKRVGNNIVLSWPASFSGYVLEQTLQLVAPVWTVVSQTPANDGFLYSVTLSLSPGSMFYRLALQPPAPRLTIARSGGAVIISWPSPSTGWTLQQNTDLHTANWVAAPTPSDDGIIKYLIVNPPTDSHFYRLQKP